MLFRRKKPAPAFDWMGKIPTIRTSICTGEQTAGFLDPSSGRFFDIMLIRTDADLREFLETYGVAEEELRREY